MKHTFLNVALLIFGAILVFLFLKFLLSLVLILFIFALFWTWRMQKDARNRLFVNGTVPSPAPDGLHQGIFLGHHTSWRGKKFNAQDSTGINLFEEKTGGQVSPSAQGSGGTKEKYPFKTYIAKGLQEKNLDVMKIDYDVPANPFWLSFIMDEIVQIAPGSYLGKMHIKLIPGLPFTVLYFELKK
ncbi:hypothetical protein KW786_02600 [Candidatus Parcubacteria bacterium]|nr:hypothetical protein [Candidatus Parcubacteria bacterium]